MFARMWSLGLLVLTSGFPAFSADPPTLQQILAANPSRPLAKAARERGDAARGAVLFFQPFLTCVRCHDGDAGTQFGPDIAKVGKEGTRGIFDRVRAVRLRKLSRRGTNRSSMTTKDGRKLTGLLVEEKDGTLTLLDPSAGGKRIVLMAADVEGRTSGKTSLMPEGLANLLSDRQQFLDLVKYLIEVAEQGPTRAKELRPAQTALVIPEYEKEIDHAGLIRALDEKALRRGEAIYTRVCGNCHGTKDAPGSMPTSLRFASDIFKNGSDPYSLYQTLTRGYGMMPPQTWMVPRQKYDVIHYLREAYLKDFTTLLQYAKVDDAVSRRGLPKGTTLGPAAVTVEPWVTMDYGPSLINTYEVGGPGPNFAYKGIAVRLDAGAGGVSRGKRWALFDHDLMRFAAAWTGDGFIDWKGIHFNGQHQVHPKIVGDVAVANPIGPGWADPETGRFDDPRLLGRDGRRYGPLPRKWARYRGMYHFGDLAIVAYTVGDADLLESFRSRGRTRNSSPSDLSPRTLKLENRAPTSRRETCSPGSLPTRNRGGELVIGVLGRVSPSFERTRIGSPFSRFPLRAATPVRVKLLMAKGRTDALDRVRQDLAGNRERLKPLTEGGPKRWPETLKTAHGRPRQERRAVRGRYVRAS